MTMMEELNEFFDLDLRVKKSMSKLMINRSYMYDESYIDRYVKDAYVILKEIISDINKMAEYLGEEEYVINYLNTYFDDLINDFNNCAYDGDKLDRFEQSKISNIDSHFIAKISQSLSAYTIIRDKSYAIFQANTVNEMLHAMHLDVLNNDDLLTSLGKLEDKSENGQSFILYGDDNSFARYIFDLIDTNIPSDIITAVSINKNKIILLVRDLGHATSIEIDRVNDGNDDDIRVYYFIPKLCDIEKINKLKGVTKVNENTPVFHGTTGIFYSNARTISDDLNGLLKGIPTDLDLYKDVNKDMRI